jgi:hypothetical protein
MTRSPAPLAPITTGTGGCPAIEAAFDCQYYIHIFGHQINGFNELNISILFMHKIELMD